MSLRVSSMGVTVREKPKGSGRWRLFYNRSGKSKELPNTFRSVRLPAPILQLTFAPDRVHLAVVRQPGVLELVPVDVPFMQAEARRIRECGQRR